MIYQNDTLGTRSTAFICGTERISDSAAVSVEVSDITLRHERDYDAH